MNGDQQCENFIATQITNKGTVETLYSGIELVFENDKLIRAYDYEEGNRKDREQKGHSFFRFYNTNNILLKTEKSR